MNHYNLSTWVGDQITAYEPLLAAGDEMAISFTQGVLTERTKGRAEALMKDSVVYVVEQGYRGLQDMEAPSRSLGAWYFEESFGVLGLVWKRAIEAQEEERGE